MSFGSKPLSVAAICATAWAGFEVGWQVTGDERWGTQLEAARPAPSAQGRGLEQRSAARPTAPGGRVAVGCETLVASQGSYMWIARPAPSFDQDGQPGQITGPRTLPAGTELPEASRFAKADAARIWLVQGERLWSATQSTKEGTLGLRPCNVLGWFRLRAESKQDGAEVAVQAVLAEGLPLPIHAGRVPLLDEQVFAASPGFVPARLRLESVRGSSLRVRLDRAATLRGALGPAPRRGARLWLELAGGAGALDLELGAEGAFRASLVPEGFHILHLEAHDRVLGYYGGIGVPVRAPETDLSNVELCRSGTLRLDVTPATKGPLYLLAYNPGQRPEPAEHLTRRVFTGERLAVNSWRFAGIRVPFAGGWVWSEDGSQAELPALALGTDGRELVACARLDAPASCRLRLRGSGSSEGESSWEGWRVVATPASLGRADPLWVRRKERQPWLRVRRHLASPEGRVALEGLSKGDWWFAALSPTGTVVAKRRIHIEQAGESVNAGSWQLPGLGGLDIVAPRCARHSGTYALWIALGEGIRPKRKRLVSDAREALRIRHLRAGEHVMLVRFEPEVTGPHVAMNLGDVARPIVPPRTRHVMVVTGDSRRIEIACSICLGDGIAEQRAPRDGPALAERAARFATPEERRRRR